MSATKTEQASAIEQLVRDAYKAMAQLDVGHITGLMTDEIQGVDEITRAWKRGPEVREHLNELIKLVTRLDSTITDLVVKEWGDTALVTFMVTQAYTVGEFSNEVKAPTSMVMRREGDTWKVVLFHSVALPEYDTGS